MNSIKKFLRNGIGLALTAASILGLILLVNLIIGGVPHSPIKEPLSEGVGTGTPVEIYPPPPTSGPPAPTTVETLPPQETSTPSPEPDLPETPPAPAGKAATLFKGDIWLVEPGVKPQLLTNFGDVSGIFGWNWDGSLLLFGRGSWKRTEFYSDTTSLWFIDLKSKDNRQITSSIKVASAAWSPTINQIAYCEDGDILTIIELNGEILNQHAGVMCDFTWSPDGASIALETYTPDMILPDGLKYDVIAVWWLEADKLQIFSQAKDEAQYWPVWSIDSRFILYQQVSYDPAKQINMCWWHIIDVTSGEVRCLGNVIGSAEEISRSPKGNMVSFRVGDNIYIGDFDGHFKIIGQGRLPTWLSNGQALLYETISGNLQIINVEVNLEEATMGGQQHAPNLFIHPQYYFVPNK